VLRVETLAPSLVHVGVDGWLEIQDIRSVDTGLGVWVADIDTSTMPGRRQIDFTFYWPDVNHWEGDDFHVVMTRK